MKEYQNEVIINKPMDEVITLFTESEHFTRWQPDLLEYDVYEGDPCCSSSKARLRYRSGKSDDVKMLQVVEKNDLPDEYRVRYESDGVFLRQYNHFEPAGGGKTLYRMKSEYSTDGLMKLMKLFKPGYFEKQSEKFVQGFKEYTEEKN